MRNFNSVLYFVVDVTKEINNIPTVISSALKGGVDIVQLWGSFEERKSPIYREVRNITRDFGVPLLNNNSVEIAERFEMDGVHLDEYNMEAVELKRKHGNNFVVGYTIGNSMERAIWAERVGADYISFCSVFKSKTVDVCEIVPLTLIPKAKKRVKIPVFASGGINRRNARYVLDAGADGIAVISSIQNSENPEKAARTLKNIILNHALKTRD